MALTLKDILRLPSLAGFKLAAGEGGLDHVVVSAGIADYEFAPGIDYDLTDAFEKDSLVISSLLFAREDPELLLPAIRHLHKAGIAAFACKRVVFDVLPEEVLRYGREHDFPIFLFGGEAWFETIIFEVMTAVEQDDARYLSEGLLRDMIHGTAAAGDIDTARRGISLLLRKTVSAVYLKQPGLDTARVCRSYYMSKHLKEKVLVVRYDGGLFLLITSDRNTPQAHSVILREAVELLGIPLPPEDMILSRIHPAASLDVAIRQAWYGRMAGFVAADRIRKYEDLGVYAPLMPLVDTPELQEYAADYRERLSGHEGTVAAYVKSGGDIALTAAALDCHANTIRYRLARMKELLGSPEKTDHELFRDLAVAHMIWEMED